MIDKGILPAQGRSSVPADHTIVAHTSVSGEMSSMRSKAILPPYLPDDGRTKKKTAMFGKVSQSAQIAPRRTLNGFSLLHFASTEVIIEQLLIFAK